MPFTYEKWFVKIHRTVCVAPDNPSMNRVDYSVYEGLCSAPISSLGDLENRVRTCWENLVQQIMDISIDYWRDKLKSVVWLIDWHIKQLFWQCYLFAAVLCYVAYEF